jgi:hypothetical protein
MNHQGHEGAHKEIQMESGITLVYLRVFGGNPAFELTGIPTYTCNPL